jgi:hypothetical protein
LKRQGKRKKEWRGGLIAIKCGLRKEKKARERGQARPALRRRANGRSRGKERRGRRRGANRWGPNVSDRGEKEKRKRDAGRCGGR